MRIATITIALVMSAACGIPGDTPLQDLDSDQHTLICERAVDTDAPDRTVDCDGTEITIEATTVAQCEAYFQGVIDAANPDCSADLDTWISCQEEPDLTDGQICGTEEYEPSAACTALAVCATPPAGE